MTNEEFVKLYNMKLQELKEECAEQVKKWRTYGRGSVIPL